MRRFLAIILIAFIVCGSFVAMAEDKKLDPPKMGEMVKLETYADPAQLPEVLLSDATKGLVYLSDHKNKIVMLNLWATWCPPCVTELPSLNALQVAMGSDKFQVVTVSLDQGEAGIKNAKKFLDDNSLTALTQYVDGNNEIQKMQALKGVSGIPVTLILDPNMRVLARFQGDTDWNGKDARAVIDYYLANIETNYNPYLGRDMGRR